ncbi:putative deoxyribonuclease YjjV [compost metagenome]
MGEFGLDYYVQTLDRERQQALFEAQLQLAVDFHLPALLHVRRSHAPVIAALKRFRLQRGGIIHAFSGSLEEAREYIKLVLETDSPDMAPAMFPGMRNSPEHLPQIAQAHAELLGITVGELAQVSSRNACELFHWA